MRIIHHNLQTGSNLTPDMKLKQQGQLKKLRTVKIKIQKLFCYDCYMYFPNVQSFESHGHEIKEEVDEMNSRTSSPTVNNQLSWTANNAPLINRVTESVDENYKEDGIQCSPKNTNNTLHSLKTVGKENTKSSAVKEPTPTNINLNLMKNNSGSTSKPLEEKKNPTKTIYVVSKSNPGNNDSNSIKHQLPGTILSSTTINLKDLKDYFRCYKCNSSFYKLEDLVLHFRNCKMKTKSNYHEFKNLKCLKHDKTTQTLAAENITDKVENDKENAIPIPMDSSSLMEVDQFDDDRPSLSPPPSPLPPPSVEKLNNDHFNNPQPSTSSSSTSASLQPDVEIPERPGEFITYNGRPTVKYLEVVKNGTTEEGTFECRICHQVYTRNQLLYDHLVEHQQQRPTKSRLRKCSACDFRTRKKIAMDEHMLKNHPVLHASLFHCNHRRCGHRPFPTEELLMQHKQDVHPIQKGPFICHLCGDTLKNPKTLKLHLLRHEDGTPYKCKYPDCDKSFKTTKDCKKHELTHEEKKFKCTEEGCDKAFRESSGLRDHKNGVHLGITPYKCPYPNCEVSFSSIVKRLQHSYVHREAIFKCQFVDCNAAFKKRESLKKHSLCHEGDSAKKFKCTYSDCSFRTNSKTKLRGHIEGTHQKVKRFLCTTCGYSSYTSTRYKNHLLSHTDLRPFKCDSCDLKFKDRSGLKHHKITHTDDRTLRCEFCDKLFKQRPTLQRHLQIHTNFKPYRCAFCADEFPDNRPLKKHVAREHEGEYEFDLNIPATYQIYAKPSIHKPLP